jgi:hypothetical protein
MKRLMLLAFVGTAAVAAPLDMKVFDQVDFDRDGFVDQVEAMGSIDLQGRFNDIDVDRDGRLSMAEMQAWIDRPDKPSQLRDSAPLNVHEQWRAVEAQRLEREAQRVERILAGEEPAADTASGAAPTSETPR